MIILEGLDPNIQSMIDRVNGHAASFSGQYTDNHKMKNLLNDTQKDSVGRMRLLRPLVHSDLQRMPEGWKIEQLKQQLHSNQMIQGGSFESVHKKLRTKTNVLTDNLLATDTKKPKN